MRSSNTAAAGLSPPDPSAVRWQEYGDEFLEGVPLLRSSAATIDYAPVEKIVRSLVESLASSPLPGKLAEEARLLSAEIRSDPDAAHVSGFGEFRSVNWSCHIVAGFERDSKRDCSPSDSRSLRTKPYHDQVMRYSEV